MENTCTVTNRSSGLVIYNVPELNVRREFYPKEVKKNIPVTEIEKVAAQPGGRELLYNYLFVEDKEVIHEVVNVEEEPEYWLKEEDIPNWMNTCTLDAFKDALDFAPQGVLDLIKSYAISLPLNDFAKRQAIKEQLNFDVTKALELTASDEKVEETTTKATRRVTTTTEPTRRVTVIATTDK
jgi:hypothetical protein